jgi:hypothetical protein
VDLVEWLLSLHLKLPPLVQLLLELEVLGHRKYLLVAVHPLIRHLLELQTTAHRLVAHRGVEDLVGAPILPPGVPRLLVVVNPRIRHLLEVVEDLVAAVAIKATTQPLAAVAVGVGVLENNHADSLRRDNASLGIRANFHTRREVVVVVDLVGAPIPILPPGGHRLLVAAKSRTLHLLVAAKPRIRRLLVVVNPRIRRLLEVVEDSVAAVAIKATTQPLAAVAVGVVENNHADSLRRDNASLGIRANFHTRREVVVVVVVEALERVGVVVVVVDLETVGGAAVGFRVDSAEAPATTPSVPHVGNKAFRCITTRNKLAISLLLITLMSFTRLVD